jgi:hypothetical protein
MAALFQVNTIKEKEKEEKWNVVIVVGSQQLRKLASNPSPLTDRWILPRSRSRKKLVWHGTAGHDWADTRHLENDTH